VFDMLATVAGFDIEGAAVLDLFAGSGALGLEALSRGAGSAVFVDRAPASVKAIWANLEAIGLDPTGLDATGVHAEDIEVVRAEAVGWLASPRRFDLALVDPPYAFDDWGTLLGRLDAAVAVLESDRELVVPVTWEILKHKRYGDTLVMMVRHAGPARPGQKGSP
jgi:16S rRNA (guanine966-N2)-methyltransferase